MKTAILLLFGCLLVSTQQAQHLPCAEELRLGSHHLQKCLCFLPVRTSSASQQCGQRHRRPANQKRSILQLHCGNSKPRLPESDGGESAPSLQQPVDPREGSPRSCSELDEPWGRSSSKSRHSQRVQEGVPEKHVVPQVGVGASTSARDLEHRPKTRVP